MVGLVLTALVAATACSSSGSTAPKVRTSATPHAGLPSGVSGATNVPTSVPNDPARRADVTLAHCAAAPGGWAAGGTIQNPRTKASTYRITVFFTTTSATVVGVGKASVHVSGGASQAWQAVGHFHPPAKTLCVLRGVGVRKNGASTG